MNQCRTCKDLQRAFHFPLSYYFVFPFPNSHHNISSSSSSNSSFKLHLFASLSSDFPHPAAGELWLSCIGLATRPDCAVLTTKSVASCTVGHLTFSCILFVTLSLFFLLPAVPKSYPPVSFSFQLKYPFMCLHLWLYLIIYLLRLFSTFLHNRDSKQLISFTTTL